jgi:hypothetical protein
MLGTEKVVEGDLVYCEEPEHQADSKDVASSLNGLKEVNGDGVVDEFELSDPYVTSDDNHKVKVKGSEPSV